MAVPQTRHAKLKQRDQHVFNNRTPGPFCQKADDVKCVFQVVSSDLVSDRRELLDVTQGSISSFAAASCEARY
jgi:hypothetical protein